MGRYILIILFTLNLFSSVARDTYPFNEGWRFFFKHENSSDNARIISLPHTWNTDAINTTTPYLRTVANYLNNIYIPEDWSERRLFVKFYGVQNVANVFINGLYLGEHRGGATAFTFEITDRVKFGANNSFLVEVSNVYEDDVLPTSTEMNIFGGIHRNVELIVTDKVAISPLYHGSDGILIAQNNISDKNIKATAQVHLTSTSGEDGILRLDIESPTGRNVFSKTIKVKLNGNPVTMPFAIDNPLLWSIDNPFLYKVTASIESEEYSDSHTVTTGFRSISVSPADGFRLNDERIKVKGVTLYHDNIVRGGALTDIDYDNDLEIIKDLGANAIHSAVMPHAQYLYDRCDQSGVLVWVDIPFFRAPFFSDISYYPTSRFEANGLTQIREIIAQNINHPSVVMWGIFSLQLAKGDNVIPYIKTLNAEAKKMDSSRPTVALSNQDGELNLVTDLIVWQQSLGWDKGSTNDIHLWCKMLKKSWSHLTSAVSYGAPGFINHRSFDINPTTKTNWVPENRQTQFHEEYTKNINTDSLFWGVWINNIFDYSSIRHPYGVNGSGLVSLNRREFKDAYYLYKAIWNSEQQTLHLPNKRSWIHHKKVEHIKVYSSAPPTLTIDRDTIEMYEYAPHQYISDTISKPNNYMVRVYSGKLRDSVKIRYYNSSKLKLSLVPQKKVDPPVTDSL